jgi:glucose/arabinose dehydrogenase
VVARGPAGRSAPHHGTAGPPEDHRAGRPLAPAGRAGPAADLLIRPDRIDGGGGRSGLRHDVPPLFTYAYGTREANNTRLASARLAGDELVDLKVLFSATPKAGTSHYGGRIAFLRDGTLALSLGDGFDRREDAQNPANHLGKIVRIGRDGSIPPDNPFVGREGHAAEILSLGHRNVQGIAVDPVDASLLVSEHGPRGGDEINVVRPGRNYGWPLVTDGLDYTSARVTPFKELPGFEAPLLIWTPSIAPSGLAAYRGTLFPGWQGDLLVPALVERGIRRIRREGGRVTAQETLLTELKTRIRDVRVMADGAIEALTDETDGKLLRIIPAQP